MKRNQFNLKVEHYVVKSDLSIKITDELRQILVEDHNNICNNNKVNFCNSLNCIALLSVHVLKFNKKVG